MCDLTDAELVEAARKGEASAFGELVRRHQKQAFAVTLSLINDVAEAEDLTQESFIRAFRNLDLGIAQIRHFEPKEWLHSFDFTCRKSN